MVLPHPTNLTGKTIEVSVSRHLPILLVLVLVVVLGCFPASSILASRLHLQPSTKDDEDD